MAARLNYYKVKLCRLTYSYVGRFQVKFAFVGRVNLVKVRFLVWTIYYSVFSAYRIFSGFKNLKTLGPCKPVPLLEPGLIRRLSR